MAAIIGAILRNWQNLNPPVPEKNRNALRFGILGAADIGPRAILTPAKSHPDVVVQAVAARDRAKGEAYARKYGITEVKSSYQDILDDPNIDCVYIPLPIGLHYEWSLKALKAGKHVLVEKPSFSNAEEAELIFKHQILSMPTAPVLLEAAHYLFHPAWTRFISLNSPENVLKAKAVLWTPKVLFNDDNIRFQYELAGGAMMDLGTYTASALIRIFGGLPEACEKAVVEPGSFDARCDRQYLARYRFQGGRVGEMEGHLQAPFDRFWPWIDVQHRPVVIPAAEAGTSVEEGQEVVRTRRIKFINFVAPHMWHSIQVHDELAVRKISDEQGVLKLWKKSETIKAYSFHEAGIEQDGEPFWGTYRYQLEQFVNKVRNRPTPQWVDSEKSTDTSRMIDMAYSVTDLPLRLTSKYR